MGLSSAYQLVVRGGGDYQYYLTLIIKSFKSTSSLIITQAYILYFAEWMPILGVDDQCRKEVDT